MTLSSCCEGLLAIVECVCFISECDTGIIGASGELVVILEPMVL